MPKECLHAIALLLVPLTLPLCTAGVCTSDPQPGERRHEFEFLAGYSPVSTTLIGVTSGSRLVLAGFSYSYRCWAWKRASISFTPGIMPAAVVLEQPPAAYQSARRVYGFGITPLGFRLEFLRSRRVYPFVQTDGGIIASTQPIPDTSPSGLNFLVDLGAGVRWHPRDRKYGFELGYKLLHISNAATSYVDPGVDNNVFYAGFLIFR
jgi:hypothetical protein